MTNPGEVTDLGPRLYAQGSRYGWVPDGTAQRRHLAMEDPRKELPPVFGVPGVSYTVHTLCHGFWTMHPATSHSKLPWCRSCMPH